MQLVKNYAMKIEWHAGDVIKKLRESADLTQEQLAELAKIPRTATIGAVENTGNYKRETLKKIASALNVRDADILSLIPGNELAPAQTQPDSGLCPNNPEHRKYQIMLDQIFHENEQRGEWIRGNVITFHERLFGPSGGERNDITSKDRPFSAQPNMIPTDNKTIVKTIKRKSVRYKP